ncbi:hypothetical protein ILUMI_15374, partial [Ignelater luminosus]
TTQQKRKIKGTNIFIDKVRTNNERRIQGLTREKSYAEKLRRKQSKGSLQENLDKQKRMEMKRGEK